MITLLTGANEFAIGERLSQLRAEFSSRHGEQSVVQTDAADATEAELIKLANANLFSAETMFIIKDVDGNKEIADKLPDYLSRLAEATHLVLVSPKPDKRTRWYKTAAKLGQTQSYSEPNEPQLIKWAQERVKQRGGAIEPTVARYLVNRIGLHQGQISQELEKLVSYSPTITKEHIDLLVDKTLNESVFDLIDSVVKGRTKRAVNTYERLLLNQVDAHQFIGLMAWQLHNLLVVKANEHTLSPSQLASAAGLAPFVVSKTRALASHLSLGQIKKLISLTVQADVDIKRTRADVDARIKVLIEEIGLIV